VIAMAFPSRFERGFMHALRSAFYAFSCCARNRKELAMVTTLEAPKQFAEQKAVGLGKSGRGAALEGRTSRADDRETDAHGSPHFGERNEARAMASTHPITPKSPASKAATVGPARKCVLLDGSDPSFSRIFAYEQGSKPSRERRPGAAEGPLPSKRPFLAQADGCEPSTRAFEATREGIEPSMADETAIHIA
jgi:hypothetical protein